MSSPNGRAKLPPGVKRLRRKGNETKEEFNIRVSRAVAAAAEVEKTRREAVWEADHPSDTPLEKFKRVWNGDERDE